MNFMRTSYCKKAGAFSFILLFVFIHTVKALHTHEVSLASAHAIIKNATTVKADFSCTICDFQMAKDSDAIISDVEITTPQPCITFLCTYILPAYTSHVVTASGTDPPLFA
jgi:hypothetical protein